MRAALFAFVLAGCNSAPSAPVGPVAQDLEVAYEVAWEGVLGMSQDTRPRITWWAPCDAPADADATKPDAHCWWSVWRPDGTADLQWRGKFTASPATFNQALTFEKWWQGHDPNQPVPDQSALNVEVYDALLAAGL